MLFGSALKSCSLAAHCGLHLGPKDQGAGIHPAKHCKECDPSTVELTHTKAIHCSSVAELLKDATDAERTCDSNDHAERSPALLSLIHI